MRVSDAALAGAMGLTGLAATDDFALAAGPGFERCALMILYFARDTLSNRVAC